MLDYTKPFEKVKDLYIFYYKYRVELNPHKHNYDGNYDIIFDGNPKIINYHILEFSSKEKLTKEQVEEKLKGTKYIIKISGEFDIDGEYII